MWRVDVKYLEERGTMKTRKQSKRSDRRRHKKISRKQPSFIEIVRLYAGMPVS
ncbi:MAG: hypothetical protein MJA29_06460 [Candidatus Omnitrophica bacterium]|nr:hypothetical protein [Candidatus Omnitrophota bacterium]